MSARAHGGAVMNNDKLKQQICDALAVWIRQRPGLEFGNYGDVTSYRADARSIARDKRDAETLLIAVRSNSAITAAMILEAAKDSHGVSIEMQNHQIREHGKMPYEEMRPHIDYTTGQYWSVEYRKAAARVLAGALWEHMRGNMPKPTGKVTTTHGTVSSDHDNIDGQSPGDWLRNRFRKEFGSKLQRRWFN